MASTRTTDQHGVDRAVVPVGEEDLAHGVTRVTSEQLRSVAEKIARRRAGLFERLAK